MRRSGRNSQRQTRVFLEAVHLIRATIALIDQVFAEKVKLPLFTTSTIRIIHCSKTQLQLFFLILLED